MASSLPKYESKTLKNGLEVYVIEMGQGSNVISTDIFYKVGSRNEVMGKTGIAQMRPPVLITPTILLSRVVTIWINLFHFMPSSWKI